MIKINLLDSVTDRPKGIIDVEKEVARPRTQTAMLAAVAGFLLLCACGFNYWSTSREHTRAKTELERQQQIATQMAQIKKEKEELEKKIQAINGRIEAIQRLRAEQRGPVAVLDELSGRVNSHQGLFLKSVDQKGDSLTIEGFSPNEQTVTDFGSSLEFSFGLFTGLNIETRKNPPEAVPASAPAGTPPPTETVSFTIRCKYNPVKSDNNGGATNVPTAATNTAAGGAVDAIKANNAATTDAVKNSAQPPKQ